MSDIEKSGPRFEHDCEVSLVPCMGQCHYLGTEVNGDKDAMDLYIHVHEGEDRTELLARWGNEDEEYLSESLSTMLYNYRDRWEHIAGPEGYGIRLAYEAALRAGYLLPQMESRRTLEDPKQAYNDSLSDGGNPYTDAAGMVEEGADSLDY